LSDEHEGKANPEFWRRRAREARFQAARTTDPESKQAILSIADTYERMAERAEAHIKRGLDRT
jgi:hypothetical protein